MKRKALYLDLLLKEEVVEGRPEYSFFSHRARTALQDVLEILNRASQDRRVRALVLTVENLSAGWGRLSTLRRSIAEFRRSGKPALCFMQNGGNAEYYLAAACDQIFMAPAGNLNLVGLTTEVFFFREVLERLGVKPQLQSIGEYKSAGEMFTRTGLSEPAREQWNDLLDDLFEEFRQAIADSRHLDLAEIGNLVDSGPYTATEAVSKGLIDGTCYHDELEGRLHEKLGTRVYPVAAARYFSGEGLFKRLLTYRRPRIAVIDILGHINSGESRRNNAGQRVTGSDTIGQFLDHARKSSRVRGVVLRIDSPGGTGTASDHIWRKIALLRQSKPVVVSFGDVAASGGYYISAAASRILSEPTSITGSIGVLGGKFVAKELMSRLAVYRESIRRGAHAEYDSFFTPFTQAEMEKLEHQLTEFYQEHFVKKVAKGREMSEETVDRVGRGRVWSGLRAKERGLVDMLGGIPEAIQEVRRLAKIPDDRKIRLLHYYRRRRLREMLIPEFKPHLHAELLPQPALELLDVLELFATSKVLLLMPFRIRIR